MLLIGKIQTSLEAKKSHIVIDDKKTDVKAVLFRYLIANDKLNRAVNGYFQPFLGTRLSLDREIKVSTISRSFISRPRFAIPTFKGSSNVHFQSQVDRN